MQPVFHCGFYASDQCKADPALPVRPARAGCGGGLYQEKAAQSVADPEQQAVQLKRLYCGKHQRNPGNPVLCPGGNEQQYFQQLKQQLPKILDACVYVQLHHGAFG